LNYGKVVELAKDHTYDEIADIMGCSQTKVLTYIHKFKIDKKDHRFNEEVHLWD